MPEDFEQLVRNALREQAERAPAAERTVDRVLAATSAGPSSGARTGRDWRRWGLPLIVGGTVAAAVVGILVASRIDRHSAAPAHPTTAVPPTAAPPTHGAATTAGPAQSAPPTRPSPTSTAPPPAVGPAGGPVPVGLRVADLTFVGPDEGWALGTAPCASAPCTSIVRTRDGGRSWVGIPAPRANVAPFTCSTAGSLPCLTGLRFADPLHGYAFGTGALFTTSDGGATWQAQQGEAEALEPGNGVVLRVRYGACRDGCGFVVERASVGSPDWQTVQTIAPGQRAVGVDLARTGHQPFVQVYGNVAGGGPTAHSTLLVSPDDGATWTQRGEPCGQLPSGEVDASALNTGADGSVGVLCRARDGSGSFTQLSTDGGSTFRRGKMLANLQNRLAVASSGSLLIVGQIGARETLTRSTDGGSTWFAVAHGAALPLQYYPANTFLGFETPSTGRWVGVSDPRTVWTTTDAGVTWTPYTFR